MIFLPSFLGQPAPLASTPPGPGDPFWANVALLLHFDGADGMQAFADSSETAPKTMQVLRGVPTLTTSTMRFGSAAGRFLDAAIWTQGDDLRFDGDFTIECWIRSMASGRTILSASSPGGADLNLLTWSGGIGIYAAGDVVLSGGTLQDKWMHAAVSRQGSAIRLFLDGALLGSYARGVPIGGVLTVGGWNSYAGEAYQGYLDDLRITSGIARYTAPFIPPDAPFPDGSGG